jgi:hypothetical protein
MACWPGVTSVSPCSPARGREPGQDSCGSRGSRSPPYLVSNARGWGLRVGIIRKQVRSNRVNRVKCVKRAMFI